MSDQPPAQHGEYETLPRLTARQVVDALLALFEQMPETADWPVHLLDMTEEKMPESPLDGLVTSVETDVMSEEQGPVVSLVAWWNYPAWRGRIDAATAATGRSDSNG